MYLRVLNIETLKNGTFKLTFNQPLFDYEVNIEEYATNLFGPCKVVWENVETITIVPFEP